MDLLEDIYPDGHSGIDFSLPQTLVNSVKEEMDFDICPHFVMDCRGNYKLIPLTSIGRAILPVIHKVVFKCPMPE